MTRPKLKIKKGDRVVVIAGRDKRTTGEVLQVMPDENRVLVQGVNIVRRHQKQTPQQDGGVIAKEAPIHISNIAIVDPSGGAASRVGYKFSDDGRKLRYAKRSGELIDE